MDPEPVRRMRQTRARDSRPDRSNGAAAAKGRGPVLAEARHIDVRIRGHEVLTRVDAAVHAGEIVTVIGPNGSGKTTLLRVLLGLLVPDRGSVHVRPGTRIGYMPQRLAVDPTLPLTVERFLAMGADRSVPRTVRKTTLAEVGAERVIDFPIQDISGGEMQRVMLARALLREPDLLVLDEPVQGVDITGQHEVHALIGRIRDRRRCGVLMVSHDLHLVMAGTDTVLCLNRHVCCTGRPEDVTRDPAYVALFGREVAAGLAVYSHHHDHEHADSGEVLPQEQEGDRSDAG